MNNRCEVVQAGHVVIPRGFLCGPDTFRELALQQGGVQCRLPYAHSGEHDFTAVDEGDTPVVILEAEKG